MYVCEFMQGCHMHTMGMEARRRDWNFLDLELQIIVRQLMSSVIAANALSSWAISSLQPSLSLSLFSVCFFAPWLFDENLFCGTLKLKMSFLGYVQSFNKPIRGSGSLCLHVSMFPSPSITLSLSFCLSVLMTFVSLIFFCFQKFFCLSCPSVIACCLCTKSLPP